MVQTTIPVLFSGVGVTDLHGKAVESQLLEKSAVNTTVAFMAEDLPPLGWKTYYVSEAIDPLPELSNAVIADRNLIENKHLRIEMKEGVIQRIIDKDSGDPVFHAESHAVVNEILIWKDEGCISIVRPVDKEEVADFIDNPGAELVGRSSEVEGRKVTVMETGPARGVLQIEYDLDCGRFVQKISLMN